MWEIRGSIHGMWILDSKRVHLKGLYHAIVLGLWGAQGGWVGGWVPTSCFQGKDPSSLAALATNCGNGGLVLAPGRRLNWIHLDHSWDFAWLSLQNSCPNSTPEFWKKNPHQNQTKPKHPNHLENEFFKEWLQALLTNLSSWGGYSMSGR